MTEVGAIQENNVIRVLGGRPQKRILLTAKGTDLYSASYSHAQFFPVSGDIVRLVSSD